MPVIATSRRLRIACLAPALGLGAALLLALEPAQADQPADPAPRQIAIVVSERWTAIDTLDLEILRQIYLGKRTRLGGARIKPRHRLASTDIFQGFIRTVLRMTEGEVERFWIEEELKGGVTRFREFSSLGGLLRNLTRVKGAIGYVDAERLRDSQLSGVKVVGVIIEGQVYRPGDPSYRLTYGVAKTDDGS